MNPSGLIYATIVVLWAAVLVPMWLRRHDEVTESRSVDRFQGAMRTLSRRVPAGDRREVLVPRRGQTHAAPDGAFEPPTPASIASARRRRVSLAMLAVAVAVAAAAAVHRVPTWAPVLPAVVVVGFLLQAHSAARKARARDIAGRRARAAQARANRHEQVARAMGGADRDDARATVPRAAGAPRPAPTFVDPAIVGRTAEMRRRPALPVDARLPDRLGTAPAMGRAPVFVDPAIVGRTAQIRRTPPVPAAPARTAPTATVPEFYDALAAAAWDPVAVPLPTYVSAPKAPRSVRIVDLTKPGAWTSGRLPNVPLRAEDSEAAETTPQDGIVTGELLVERRRAVGD